jgi:hypothetical protein
LTALSYSSYALIFKDFDADFLNGCLWIKSGKDRNNLWPFTSNHYAAAVPAIVFFSGPTGQEF